MVRRARLVILRGIDTIRFHSTELERRPVERGRQTGGNRQLFRRVPSERTRRTRKHIAGRRLAEGGPARKGEDAILHGPRDGAERSLRVDHERLGRQLRPDLVDVAVKVRAEEVVVAHVGRVGRQRTERLAVRSVDDELVPADTVGGVLRVEPGYDGLQTCLVHT